MRNKKMQDGKILAGLGGALVIGVIAAVAFSASSVPEEATYVGPSTCQLCHQDEHEMWDGGAHATAFGDLLADEKEDSECFKCHVTGYGEETGYTSQSETPNLTGVSCEACHGPGSEHVSIAGRNGGQPGDWPLKIKSMPRGECAKCHNEHKNFEKQAEMRREG